MPVNKSTLIKIGVLVGSLGVIFLLVECVANIANTPRKRIENFSQVHIATAFNGLDEASVSRLKQDCSKKFTGALIPTEANNFGHTVKVSITIMATGIDKKTGFTIIKATPQLGAPLIRVYTFRFDAHGYISSFTYSSAYQNDSGG